MVGGILDMSDVRRVTGAVTCVETVSCVETVAYADASQLPAVFLVEERLPARNAAEPETPLHSVPPPLPKFYKMQLINYYN